MTGITKQQESVLIHSMDQLSGTQKLHARMLLDGEDPTGGIISMADQADLLLARIGPIDSEQHKEKIRVHFRKFEDGEVIAIFDRRDPRTGMAMSYQRIGQHGDVDPALLNELRNASPMERSALKAELERIGYDVEDRNLEHEEWFTVISFYEESGQVCCDHEYAENTFIAMRETAIKRPDATIVCGITGRISELQGIMFPGEGVVDAQAMIDQADVFC